MYLHGVVVNYRHHMGFCNIVIDFPMCILIILIELVVTDVNKILSTKLTDIAQHGGGCLKSKVVFSVIRFL